MNIYSNDSVVATITDQLVSDGVRLLSFFRMHVDDYEHVRIQLDNMNLPENARVLDAGCGVGEFARIALEIRPDIQFSLLNISQAQLDMCPDNTTKICADFHHIPVADGIYDAVMLDYAIGHSDAEALLAELSRVLKHGGILFIHDLFSDGPKELTDRFTKELDFIAYDLDWVMDSADKIGLTAQATWNDRCSAVIPDYVIGPHKTSIESMKSVSVRFLKSGRPIASAIARHEHIAMQYSGGKDSTAALYLLKPWWDKITVYWTNTGDPYQETLDIVNEIKSQVKNFVEIKGDVKAWHSVHGMPSDIVTPHAHEIGNMLGFGKVRLSNRFDCCWNNLMLPMHTRMEADGITLLIRGTKDSDMPTQPLSSGKVYSDIEVLYPVQDWNDDEVFDFLHQENAPVSDVYAYGMPNGSECTRCTAWWDDGKARFLKERYPEQYKNYQKVLLQSKENMQASLKWLEKEMEAENG